MDVEGESLKLVFEEMVFSSLLKGISQMANSSCIVESSTYYSDVALGIYTCAPGGGSIL